MCGIAGLLNIDGTPAEAVLVEGMSRALQHRGPDGEGVYIDGACGLGHRRLAVLDLSPAGHQPMQSADGRYVIAYNGEVYNFRELRAELEALGHRFRSRTDTEVVLAAWAEWGEAALNRFNGMFAFAIRDRRDKTLILARDRYGIKPLYHARAGGAFLFASEIKAFLQHPDFRAEIDRAGLVEYFSFQNFFTDRTLFRDVSLLPAGCWMRIGPDGLGIELRRYWDYEFREPETRLDEQEYVEELARLFRQAVNRHLVSDVDVGAYLSGGMDSGSITAVAARQIPNILSFTCGFDLHSASGLEMAYDEREAAEHMSYLFRTEHYEMVLKAGDMERCLPRLAWHLEEPRVGQSYPNFYMAQLASRFVKVCLAGTGGDEMFGGYPWRYYRAVVNNDFEQYVDKYLSYWQRLVPGELMPDFLRPVWKEVEDVDPRAIFRSVFRQHGDRLTRPEDYVNHSLDFEARTFLHGLLVIEDKLSMAHGLETRVPFLDNDLVDFAMRLPVSLKLGNLGEVVRLNENEPGAKTAKYFQRTRDGKLILRRAMSRFVPDEVTERIKQGFSAPDASWFKGDSVEYVRSTLLDRGARLYEYVDYDTAARLLHEHLDGKVNRRLLVWSLLNVEQFLSQFAPGRTAR